jgi:3-deoxy-manno-octulosonate cytidylyltransferase (CMP-KDO synthetase)
MISGKTMIQRVLQSAIKSSADSVIVATDDERIYDHCEGYSTMTGECPNGTSRVIEVAKRISSKVYINLQGDEPLVSPSDLDRLIHKCQQMKGIHTLMTRIEDDEVSNTNVVKVFCDSENECWLFTRNAEQATSVLSFKFYKHIGIYAFDRETLLKLESLDPTPNSLKESLEQLTWLDNEIPIYAWSTDHKYQAVDTIEDIQKVIDILDEDSMHHSNL